MQARLPVFACTDSNTDIGKIIVDNGFGWWCESDDSIQFLRKIDQIAKIDTIDFGNRSFDVLCEQYSVKRSYKTIMNRISG